MVGLTGGVVKLGGGGVVTGLNPRGAHADNYTKEGEAEGCRSWVPCIRMRVFHMMNRRQPSRTKKQTVAMATTIANSSAGVMATKRVGSDHGHWSGAPGGASDSDSEAGGRRACLPALRTLT